MSEPNVKQDKLSTSNLQNLYTLSDTLFQISVQATTGGPKRYPDMSVDILNYLQHVHISIVKVYISWILGTMVLKSPLLSAQFTKSLG